MSNAPTTYRHPYLSAERLDPADGIPLRQGVAENFIGILRTEDRATQRSLLRTAVLIAVLLLLAGLVIDLPEGNLFGVGMGVAALAVVAGGALGTLGGSLLTVRRYRTSLTTNWNRWMRYSIACQRIDEVHRRVGGKPAVRSAGLAATIWTLVLFTTLIVLLMTVVDGVPALDKTPVFAGYGLYIGYRLGRLLSVRLWVKQFLGSLDEMLRTGELGLWGVV